jgi:uncharacterized membrane protein
MISGGMKGWWLVSRILIALALVLFIALLIRTVARE